MYRWPRMPSLRTIALTWLALLYGILSVGILPSPAMIVRWCGRLTFERFPCENCACGCASAHECWTACCCHSTPERLAWAIREGVEPPESVEFTDAEWMAAANHLRPGSATCSMCVVSIKGRLADGVAVAAEPDEGSCCGSADEGAACCDTHGGCREPEQTCGVKTKLPSSMPCASALSCKRQMAMLAMAPLPATPRERVVIVEPAAEPEESFSRPVDWRAVTRSVESDDPPPRC